MQLHGVKGELTDYENHNSHFDVKYRTKAIVGLQAQCCKDDVQQCTQLSTEVLFSGKRLIIADHIVVDRLKAQLTVLLMSNSGEKFLQPVYFVRHPQVSTSDKLVLTFKSILIRNLSGSLLAHGLIIYGPEFNRMSLRLSTLTKKVQGVIDELKKIAVKKTHELVLNSNCDVCEFRNLCRIEAEGENNLSLLQGMRRGHIIKQNKKGIFSVHQLSYTFRPRKTPKRAKNPSKPRYYALQAQAIRENRVYIHGKPELPVSGNRIYFDIEGIPDRNFYYLIGVLVETEGQIIQKHFWVDDEKSEVNTFINFVKFVNQFSDAIAFHYGSYDTKAIEMIKKRISEQDIPIFNRLINSCVNSTTPF
jgi:predicted RecB family nuclease